MSALCLFLDDHDFVLRVRSVDVTEKDFRYYCVFVTQISLIKIFRTSTMISVNERLERCEIVHTLHEICSFRSSLFVCRNVALNDLA